MEFHNSWAEECEAAEGIRETLGLDKALGYLIGVKLINLLEASNTRPEFAAEVPNFVARIESMFSPVEIRHYLDNVRRLGVADLICTDEQYEFFQERGFFDDDPVRGSEQILLLARARVCSAETRSGV